MPVGDDIDRRVYDTLDEKIDSLARNIEILNESIFRLANNNSVKGRGGDAPLMYNMTSGDYRSDIFRGKDISQSRKKASDAERRAHREHLDKLNKLLNEKIEQLDKLTSGHLKKEIAFREKSNRIANSIARKEIEKAELLELRNMSTGDDVVEIDKEIDSLTDDIKELRKELNKTRNDFNSIGDEINKTENEIGDLKYEIRKSKEYDSWANKTEQERRREIATQAWERMTTEEKAYYNNNFNQFSEAKDAQHEFNKRYDERSELQSMIQNSGVENTAFGKITQKAITRNQRFDNMQNFGRKMTKEGGAAKLSKQLFGTGRAATFATKAFSGLGGIVGKLGNLMSKPLIGGLLMFIDVLKFAGKAVLDGMNEYAKVTAMMVEMQTQQERVQYEQAKQHLILETQASIEKVTLAGDLALKHTEMMSQNFLEGLSIQNEAFVRSMEIGTGAMTMGVAQTAYSAAEASIDQAAKMRKYELHQGQREASFGLYKRQRQLEAESNFANIAAGLTEADVQAMIGMSDAAFKYRQEMKQEVHGGISNITSGNINGSSVVAATSGLRDETNNTTTGVRGQGNVNPLTGQSASVQAASQMSGNPLIDAGNIHGYGKIVASGLVNGQIDGFLREESANYDNMKQNIELGVDSMKTKTEQYYNFAKTEMQYQTQLEQQVVDVNVQAAEQVIDTATAVEKNWLKTTQAVEEWLRKYDEKMNDVALNVGMWTKESMAAFKEAHLATVKALAQKYGKSEEEIAAYQNAYTEQSGRNKLLNKEDLDKAVGLGVLVGDDTTVAKYVSEMEAFNQSAGDTAEMIKNEMNNINKLGLNARKYMKEVANNLKLANKYTFKEGTKSLREMVKWAEQTKFRMESLGGMIDKVREGGIEGVITQSAGFQVLGGMAAINSDPLGMLYDAWGDANAYAKRMQDMTKGFGTFDKKTGETLFNNIAENMQIEQIAKLQGRTGEELREEIRRRNQMEAIRASMSLQQKNSLTEDQIQYLSNAATYDTERQTWKVNLLNKETGAFETKDISELSSKDLENYAALSDNYEDKMTTMVEELVSLVARERGEQWLQLADQAAKDYKNTMANLNQRLKNIHEDYLKNSDDIFKEVKTKQEEITKNVKSFLEQFASNIDDEKNKINAEVVKIREKAGDITSALNYVAVSINEAQASINREWKEKLNDYQGEVKQASSNAQSRVNSNTPSNVNQAVNTAQMSPAKKAWYKYFSRDSHGEKATRERMTELNALGKNASIEEYGDVLSRGWNDLLDEMKGAGLRDTDTRGNLKMSEVKEMIDNMPTDAEIEQWKKQREGSYKKTSTYSTNYGTFQYANDAFIKSGGESMTISAPDSDVTRISDGLVQTANNDSILAFQPGGKIDNSFKGAIVASNNTYQLVREILEPLRDLSLGNSNNGGSQTVNHVFSGSIKIENNGQTMDLFSILQSNPLVLREFVSAITKEFRTTENGGKSSTFDRNRNYVG